LNGPPPGWADVAVVIEDKVNERLADDGDHLSQRRSARKAGSGHRVEREDVSWLDVERDRLSRRQSDPAFGARHHLFPALG
jgi:hypothetical protein